MRANSASLAWAKAGPDRARLPRRFDQERQLGIDGRPVLLVDAIDGERAEQVVATRGQPGHAERDPADVGDGIGVGNLRGQSSPHLVGREA